jgi:hypothetical protein
MAIAAATAPRTSGILGQRRYQPSTDFWAYAVGPLLGAALGALAYQSVRTPATPPGVYRSRMSAAVERARRRIAVTPAVAVAASVSAMSSAR